MSKDNPAEYNVQAIRAGKVTAVQLAGLIDANELVAAVKVLQSHGGLKVDGRLTPETLALLAPKKPVASRVKEAEKKFTEAEDFNSE